MQLKRAAENRLETVSRPRRGTPIPFEFCSATAANICTRLGVALCHRIDWSL